jgi:hypothetical protein
VPVAADGDTPPPSVDPDPGGTADGGGAAPAWVVERRPSPAHRAVPRIGGLKPRAALVIALGMATVALGIALSDGVRPSPSPPAAPVATSSAVALPSSASSSAPSATSAAPVGTLRAVELRLPTVDVRSALVELDVGPDGALQAPEDPDVAGWYVRGAVPGEPGPTVIAGHVDSYVGPAVFYKLDQLAPGDRVEVTRSDGRVFAYRVATVGEFPKNAFPTLRVYGPTPGPELRLITCGGVFDRHNRHYRDNVVVTAIPTT